MKINWLRRIWYKINPKYKDRLFCKIFGWEKYKRYALELYNSMNHSNYTDLSQLEIITLDDVIYIKMKNDVAYLISGNIAIYEHQSSVNLNMPVRGFMYLGELYSKILKKEGKRLYNRKKVMIPAPQCIVFYNGEEDYPEISKLRLSDSFINPVADGEYEFTVTVYNINLGKNAALLDSCSPLKGYSIFIDRIRTNLETMSMERSVDEAISYCISESILKDVLEEERSAVMLEMLTEFDEKLYEEYIREEATEQGLKQGIEQGLEQGLKQGLEQGIAQGLEQGLTQGREEERKNTDKERMRADKAEAELKKVLDWAKEHGYKG